MVAKKCLERDWSSLPQELLNLIAKNIRDISDFIRFRAVCTEWRSSTPITDLSPQFPWILQKRKNLWVSSLCFYSISFGKIYTIHAPKSIGKCLLRPSDGYFLADSHQPSLLNLLNNHEILLPPYDFCGFSYWIGSRQNQVQLHKVIYRIRGYQLVMLVSCNLDQNKWCELKLGSDYMNINNLFCLSNMLFSIENHTGVTKVKDITTGTLAYVIPPIEGSAKGTNFIIDVSGDILRIIRYLNQFADPLFCERYDVYQLDVKKIGSPCWVKVNNIGNQALFIDYINGCFTLEASDFAGIKSNSIYSLMDVYQRQKERHIYTVNRIDIETGAREHIPCPCNEPERWFVPSLQRL